MTAQSQAAAITQETRCASHHRFEMAITSLTEGHKELYGLMVGTPREPGILELLRRIEHRIAELAAEREEEKRMQKEAEEKKESRFWQMFRTAMPFLLGLLSLWLSIRLGLKA